jgi:hypothetical protein
MWAFGPVYISLSWWVGGEPTAAVPRNCLLRAVFLVA